MNAPPTDDELASDKTLLDRLKRGRDDAATAVYLRYARRLRKLAANQMPDRLAARIDPDDIVQSVFRTFFRRAGLGQYDLPDGEQLWRLLLVISLNKVRSIAVHHRAAKRDVSATVPMSVMPEVSAGSAKPEETELSILQMTIDDLLVDYPPAQRDVICLRIAGHEIDDIVARTQRSKRTVERTLQRFRQQLSESIQVPE